MSKSIKTYEDLLQEEQRLMQQLKTQELIIKDDLVIWKEKIKPVTKMLTVLEKMVSRDRTGPLASFGIDFSIDLLLRKFILAKAGWFTKIFVPFLVKNYSSHIINEESRNKLKERVQNIFNKIRPKRTNTSDN